MTKVILGVDPAGQYSPAVDLLAALRFADLDLELLHVEEPHYAVDDSAMLPMSPEWTAEVESARRESAERILASAQAKIVAAGLSARARTSLGSPARVLIDRADVEQADLIAVGSGNQSGLAQLFLGSVGRGLALGAHQSILVGRESPKSSGGLTAVFATDHSEYADKCADLLIRLRPSGIRHLVVLTATTALEPGHAFEHVMVEHRRVTTEKLDALAARFTASGLPAEAMLREGAAVPTIETVASHVQADLVIVGARGQGFFERVLIGSTSLQVMVSTRENVLMLRP